jgi:hypothetical protein
MTGQIGKNAAESKKLPAISRRTLIKTSLVLAAAGGAAAYGFDNSVKPAVAADLPAAPTADVLAFQKISQFLTSKQLDTILAGRYYTALKAKNPQLDAQVTALNDLVAQNHLGHMDDYLALQGVDEKLDGTAKGIVKTLYLGIVDDAEAPQLIAYEEAFMYQPINDILVVPTYGRGPNSWGWNPEEPKA